MNISSFLLYCVIFTFTPGPSNIYILSITQNHGAKKAFPFIYGATLALCIILIASVMLNTQLAKLNAEFMNISRIIGCLYILYLAYKIFTMKPCDETTNRTGNFVAGFIMQYVNPKVILFALTVFPTFVLPYDTEPMHLLFYVLMISALGFSANSTWAFFGTALRRLLLKHHKLTNTILAVFLLYTAIVMSGIAMN